MLTNDVLDEFKKLNAAVMMHLDQGNYSLAKASQQQWVNLYTKLFGHNHPNVGVGRQFLASFARMEAASDTAQQELAKARELRNLARQQQRQSHFAEARDSLRHALEIDNGLLGDEDYTRITVLEVLALTEVCLNSLESAGKLYTEALQLHANILGEESPNFCHALESLAAVEGKAQKHSEAETLLRRALKNRRPLAARNPRDFAMTLNSLADIVFIQKRPNEAEPYFEELVIRPQKPCRSTAYERTLYRILHIFQGMRAAIHASPVDYQSHLLAYRAQPKLLLSASIMTRMFQIFISVRCYYRASACAGILNQATL